MIVVEAGSAYAVNSDNWKALTAAQAQGHRVSVASYGCEICPVLGDLDALLSTGSDPTIIEADIHDQFLVQVGATAVLLSEGEWLAYLADLCSEEEPDLRDYGTVLGEIVSMPTEQVTEAALAAA